MTLLTYNIHKHALYHLYINNLECILCTVYTRILAERKTQNINTEIVGSAYTRITIITL